jgi:hypothetical protein
MLCVLKFRGIFCTETCSGSPRHAESARREGLIEFSNGSTREICPLHRSVQSQRKIWSFPSTKRCWLPPKITLFFASIGVVNNARNEVGNEESCGARNLCCSGTACCCAHGRGAADVGLTAAPPFNLCRQGRLNGWMGIVKGSDTSGPAENNEKLFG